MPKKLYTIIFERSDGKHTMIKQLSGRDSSDVINSWIHFLITKNIMSKEEKADLLEELEYMEPVPFTGLLNAWCESIFFQKSVYTANILQTTIQPGASIALKLFLSTSPQLEGTYEHYRREYLNVLKCDKDSQSLYTFVFEYGGGTYISQLWLSASYLDLMLVAWVEKMLQEVDGSEKSRKLIDNEADRLLLMERAMDENYYPEPISGLVNVWGTYFTLSKGLGNLTIIKTCPH